MLNFFWLVLKWIFIILIFGFIHGTISFYLDLPRYENQNTTILLLLMLIVGFTYLFDSEFSPLKIFNNAILRFTFNFKIIFNGKQIKYFNFIFYPTIISILITFFFKFHVFYNLIGPINFSEATSPKLVIFGVFLSNFIIIYGMWFSAIEQTIKSSESNNFKLSLLFSKLFNEPASFSFFIILYGLVFVTVSVLVIGLSFSASFVIGSLIYFPVYLFGIHGNFEAYLTAYLPIGSFLALAFCSIWILGNSAENFVSTMIEDD